MEQEFPSNRDSDKTFQGSDRVEIPCATVPEMPPLRQWSGNGQNRCGGDDIRVYWAAYDAVTFLVERTLYHRALQDLLTDGEKEQERYYKPEIARQRFVVSRTILKYILANILAKEDIPDIVLTRIGQGRIHVKDHPSVHISLSYSGDCIAISVGKRKLGTDIEAVRPVSDKKITSSPLFNNYTFRDDREQMRRVIHTWTMVESCGKLYDKTPYPLLNDPALFTGVNFSSYCVSRQSIFTLTAGQDRITDALVWLDTSVTRENILPAPRNIPHDLK